MIPDDLLLGVRKPAQYIGGEWNAAKKDFERAAVKFALCFPDLYEVGMSNLGVRIIYGLLNSAPDVGCERVFAPARDMENTIRSAGLEMTSLESGRRLRDFDFLGFSLGYELSYTNALNIMNLGGIPFKASLRDEGFPLVIGGGPCAMNPEPLHDFFDLFLIGEAEEAILEIIRVYRDSKEAFRSGRLDKEELLLELAGIEGVYVPSFYEPLYGQDGRMLDFRVKVKGAPARVRKRFVKDLDKAYYPSEWMVPYVEVVHDRVSLEIMRGCPNRCNFCQARAQYFPLRLKKSDNLVELASAAYRLSGYEEVSLGGLSVSDYPGIEKLLGSLVDLFKKDGVSVSLPSLKPRLLVGSLSGLLSSVKKTGLTFAPEAASERLRKVLNKDFDMDVFFNSLRQAYANGYRHVKLYFMIGLPSEEYADLDAIIDLATQASILGKKTAGRAAGVNISVNAMVPKPHTPFQWVQMQGVSDIAEKQSYLRSRLKSHKLKLRFHDCRMSFLEGVFSRGDRRLGAVLLEAFGRGARFDGWGDYFDFGIWTEAFKEHNIDPQFYLRQRAKDEVLPWDILDIGIPKESLATEAP
ncbi:MAG: TIGR03960 family B12-binding radical SAM protein [Candidatus Omnitrophota bacterium]